MVMALELSPNMGKIMVMAMVMVVAMVVVMVKGRPVVSMILCRECLRFVIRAATLP